MKKRTLIITAVILLLAVGLSWFAISRSSGRVRVAGGARIGMYTEVMEDLVALWSEHTGYRFGEVASSSGSKANITSQAQMLCDLAVCGADYVSWARTGANAMGGARAEASAALCGLYTDYMQILVRADSDIKTLADLQQRTVMLDQGESTSYYNARTMLDKVGVYTVTTGTKFKNITALKGSFYDGLLAVQRGEADVVMGIRPLGDRYVTEALNDPENPLKMLSLDAGVTAGLTEPYFIIEDVEIEGVKIKMAGVKTTLIVPYTMKDAQVTKLLETLCDNIGELKDVRGEDTSDRTREIGLEDLTKGFDRDLMHPAARAFFEGRGMLN